MAKIYMKKNGSGKVSAGTINVPITLVRKLELEGKDLELVETNKGLLIREKINANQKSF